MLFNYPLTGFNQSLTEFHHNEYIFAADLCNKYSIWGCIKSINILIEII